jgi:hypothetical protein
MKNKPVNKTNTESRRNAIKKIGGGAAAILATSINLNTFAAEHKNVSPANTVNKPQGPYGFKYFVGVVGNPSVPDISWSDDELTKIKGLGVNMLQLSIAWGGKPANEVLNLEDMDDAQNAKFKFRISQAKKFGFKTMAQFGMPRMLNYSPVRPACILDPKVRDKYAGLLQNFMTNFPEVNDILVYTFDQQAWLCSEYGPCPRCSGIPLHERLPSFLNHLNQAAQKLNPDSVIWWKPWELTKGQTQNVLQNLNPQGFGLVLNPSTSNEVYPFNDRSFKSDLGVKRLVQLAVDRNMPVIGEFDHTLYKGLYQIADYFPKLVYEQLQGWKQMEGITGIKEYYGFAPAEFSVNAAMLKACMEAPDAPLDTLLKQIAAPYGNQAAGHMIQAWEYVARAVEAFPWDTTYLIGPMGLDRGNDGSHNWEPVTIPNSTWDTPIWQANRRANFMLTQDHKAHPWLFEDAGLRLEDSAALHYKAVEFFDKAIAVGKNTDDIRKQRDFVHNTARALRGKSLHFLETLAAQDARMVMYDEQQFNKVIARLNILLTRDMENQGNNSVVTQKLADLKNNPAVWLNNNLNPRTYESICTIDWSKWVPYPNA